MERAPDMLANTVSRLIAMAESLVGSPDDVKASMQCSAPNFVAYCDGKKEPSAAELDRLLTLIANQQAALIAKHHDVLAEARKKSAKR